MSHNSLHLIGMQIDKEFPAEEASHFLSLAIALSYILISFAVYWKVDFW